MSRRHTSTIRVPMPARVAAYALVLVLAAGAALPFAAAGQGGRQDRIADNDIQQEWQVLRQRNENGRLGPVPAGVGATLLLRAESAFGVGACGTYDSTYERRANLLTIFVEEEDIDWQECDEISEQFDRVFYENLRQVVSIDRIDRESGVLELNDAIGSTLMTLSRADIEDDPTAARWDIARIGGADGSIQPTIDGPDTWVEFLPGGSVVGGTGCGSFLGKYSTNENAIAVRELAYRLETCTEGARSQAQRIVDTVAEITDFSVRPSGLLLQDELGNTRLALEPDIDFGNRTWTPVAVYDRNGNELRDAQPLSTSTVQFSGNKVEGRSICRPYEAVALRSGLAITVDTITFTSKPCKQKARGVQIEDIEADFIGALEATASHALRGSELELKDVSGVTRMRLLPQPPLVGPTWVVQWMAQGKNRPAASGEPMTITFDDVTGVFQGETGATDRAGENSFFGLYRVPGASRLTIDSLTRDGTACRGKKKAARPACKQEQRFLQLLRSANGYIVRDDDLRLLKNTRDIVGLRRETAILSEE